jgi:membrane protein
VANPLTKIRARVASGVDAVRRKRPFLDHLLRAYSRYSDDAGDRQAAAVTYFGFLSFFPLVVLAFSITGFLVDAFPSVQDHVTKAFNDYLPGLSDKLDIESVGNAKVATGVVGIAGLLWAGLGWVDALRDAVRTMWHHETDAGNIAIKKLNDVLILAGLGSLLLLSTVVTGGAASAAGFVLDRIGATGALAHALLTGLGIALGIGVDVLVFLFLFTRLPRISTPFRKVLRGALFGAVGFGILKIVGAVLIARTTNNPIYGTFAVVIGLLIWINFVTRLTLFTAAWTVTGPFDTDVPPSGSSSELPESQRAEADPHNSYPDEPLPADTRIAGNSTVSANGSTPSGRIRAGSPAGYAAGSDRSSRTFGMAGAVGAGVLAAGTLSLLAACRARRARR